MASSRVLDSRWVRRYRVFFIVGSIILSIQVFLAYKVFPIDSARDDHEQHELSGKGKVSVELPEDIDGVSSRRVKDNDLVVDDEDSPSNSNPDNGVYNKHKVPPDKFDMSDGVRNIAAIVEKVPQHLRDKSGAVQWNNRTSLRLEELDFVPFCDINTKEAISAIHRAKTQRCKQLLVNITCLIQQGQLYPEVLSSSCSSLGYTAGKSLGCYRDEKTFRLLTGYYANLKNTNSPQYCINMCLQSGFPYSGVQYSSECFCGNEKPPSTSRLPDSSCNMKCPGDTREACGGYFTINIYETGISKFTPQVPKEKPDSGTRSVRIAFLLTLNGRALRQVWRLLKVLFHKDHYFYIHVDSRQDYLFRELLILEQSFPNVKIARNRFVTIWGGASLLQMLLTSMKELLASDWKWDFVINLSESDFPVKTNQQLVDFLTANKYKNFVKSHGREVQRFIQKQGLDKTFVECDAHMWRVGDRHLPWGIQVDGGSDWVALSRPFVAYISERQSDPLLVGLSNVFRYTLLPAETFFHTALRNSQFCETYIDNNLHVTNWKRRLGCKCQYKHVVDWCGCSPNDFRSDDWSRLQGTENRLLFFARKFEPVINQAVINQLDEWLYGSYPTSLPGLQSYWQNVYHDADLSPSPDDALITIACSISRIAIKQLNSKLEGCSFVPRKILSVNSYYHQDIYKGSLVHFDVQSEQGLKSAKLETWIRPTDHVTLFDNKGISLKFKSVFVSSDFDQKEQVSRNPLRVLGPFSEPTLVYQIVPGSTLYNITALWVDPVGQLVCISEIHMEEASLIGSVKPQLRDPLLPGIWQVKLAYNYTVIAQTQFLISPLEFMSGAAVSQQQASFVHSGPAVLYNAYEDSEWEKLAGSKTRDQELLHRKAIHNARRFGLDLRDWIDSLIMRFYQVLETCNNNNTFGETNSCNSIKLKQCVSTDWSSFSPDPKSTLGTVNATTGLMQR